MMETLALYLLKSVTWLTGFALVYILALRNERFFGINRLFLLSGIVAALFLPFVTVTYKVILPLTAEAGSGLAAGNTILSNNGSIARPDIGLMLFCLYLAGLLLVVFMLIKQLRSLFKIIRRSKGIPSEKVRLVKTDRYHSAFSFFTWVFVNPSLTETEIREIMNHEMVHVRQKHWIDLMLAELLCVLQWFNPVIWIYIRLIRQNHEYLADKVALQRTSDPAIYRAALLNQIVGSPVISLVNSFNSSLNKKRFVMMENIFSSPHRKLKLLLILPVFAIVFYAFAKPEYHYALSNGNSTDQDTVSLSSGKMIKGTILAPDGNPLQGANIVIAGTTRGTSSDAAGNFSFENVPAGAELFISYVGYKSKVLKSGSYSGVPVKMVPDTITYMNRDSVTTPPPPPPPPPPPASSPAPPASSPTPPAFSPAQPASSPAPPASTPTPPTPSLVIVDGVIKDIDINSINPEMVQSITVLKDRSATDKYGEKGRNGVIEITTVKTDSTPDRDKSSVRGSSGFADDKDQENHVFVVVEELPEFTGGGVAMSDWIVRNLKYPAEAYRKKITGKVFVGFTVSATGKIKDVRVEKLVNPLLDAEAERLISSMPDWKPGTQNSKTVNVRIKIPVEFRLQ